MAVMRFHSLNNLLFHALKIEARRLLQRWKVDECLRSRRYDLLHQDKAPNLEAHPIEVGHGLTHPRPLEWIKAQVRQEWPIGLHSSAQPSSGLVDEPILVVADTNRTQCPFGKIKDLPALRRTIASNQVELIIAIQMNFVGLAAELLSCLQLLRNIGIVRCGEERREPILA